MSETLYFAYGSNINLQQMAVRCPAAQVVEPAVLEGYELLFRGNAHGYGVATIRFTVKWNKCRWNGQFRTYW